MRRILMVGLLLLAGCQGLVGPRQRRDNPQPVDVPGLPMNEQQRRVRELLAVPQPSPTIGPRTYMEQPSERGTYGH
jgi:hypothetical protein